MVMNAHYPLMSSVKTLFLSFDHGDIMPRLNTLVDHRKSLDGKLSDELLSTFDTTQNTLVGRTVENKLVCNWGFLWNRSTPVKNDIVEFLEIYVYLLKALAYSGSAMPQEMDRKLLNLKELTYASIRWCKQLPSPLNLQIRAVLNIGCIAASVFGPSIFLGNWLPALINLLVYEVGNHFFNALLQKMGLNKYIPRCLLPFVNPLLSTAVGVFVLLILKQSLLTALVCPATFFIVYQVSFYLMNKALNIMQGMLNESYYSRHSSMHESIMRQIQNRRTQSNSSSNSNDNKGSL